MSNFPSEAKYTADAPLQPKGAHNRRLSLGLEPEALAAEAGVTTEQLRDYERTSPDHDFDLEVARRVTATLDRLEQRLPNSQTGRSEHAGHNAPTIQHGASTMDHASHPRLAESELNSHTLTGATIYGADDHTVGKVSHLHGAGPDAQVIIDVGGFLGLGAKPVAVRMRDLDFMRDENNHVHAVTSWTKDQLEKMPEHQHHH
jgi:hypothetical protein